MPSMREAQNNMLNTKVIECARRTRKQANDLCAGLLRSLCGHPSIGLYWERRYKSVLKETGFKETLGWEYLFHHEQYKVILGVYVDDFKTAGRKSELATARDEEAEVWLLA